MIICKYYKFPFTESSQNDKIMMGKEPEGGVWPPRASMGDSRCSAGAALDPDGVVASWICASNKITQNYTHQKTQKVVINSVSSALGLALYLALGIGPWCCKLLSGGAEEGYMGTLWDIFATSMTVWNYFKIKHSENIFIVCKHTRY